MPALVRVPRLRPKLNPYWRITIKAARPAGMPGNARDHTGLGHMTQITNSVLEGSLWDRVDEAAKSAAEGKPFERIPFEFFKDSHPWIHTRPLMEP